MSKSRNATRGFHNRVAAVFDYDRTLSSGTVDALLERLGIEDSQAWRRDKLQPMVDDGWDEILAKGHLLARTAEEQGCTLTRQMVEEVGAGLTCYAGVEEMLEELREIGTRESGGAQVELYVLSSGFVDMMAQSAVAKCFDRVWGSSFHWGEDGTLAGIKRTVTHSEKSRYLLALAKGLEISGANEPQDVHQDRPDSEWHVPLDQMIYVGDGASDIAAFGLMRDGGGVAIAVDHSEEDEDWQASDHIFGGARVENLAPPDFREGAEMRRSLALAMGIVARRVALRCLAQGE